MNQLSLNTAILSFAFSGVFAPHAGGRKESRPSPYPESWKRVEPKPADTPPANAK